MWGINLVSYQHKNKVIFDTYIQQLIGLYKCTSSKYVAKCFLVETFLKKLAIIQLKWVRYMNGIESNALCIIYLEN